MVPKSFSQATVALPGNGAQMAGVAMAESRPTTNIIENQRENFRGPEQLNRTFSLPSGFDMSQTDLNQNNRQSQFERPDQQPVFIEENIDGEESKESLLSQ